MIIVYADSAMKDVRTLKPISLEFAFGSDENDFELQMPYSAPRLYPFCYVYIDGTELGGMITDVKNDLEKKDSYITATHGRGYLNTRFSSQIAERII